MLPVALILFLQWLLRPGAGVFARGQTIRPVGLGAFTVSLAMTFATRERTHLAVDAIAPMASRAHLRGLIALLGRLSRVAPWAAF